MRGSPHPKRDEAVALLLAGYRQSDIVRSLDVPQQSVSQWAGELSDEDKKQIVEAQGGRFVEGVGEFLLATLTMLTTVADTIADPEYIKSKDPDKLGILVGVLADKVPVVGAVRTGRREPEK